MFNFSPNGGLRLISITDLCQFGNCIRWIDMHGIATEERMDGCNVHSPGDLLVVSKDVKWCRRSHPHGWKHNVVSPKRRKAGIGPHVHQCSARGGYRFDATRRR